MTPTTLESIQRQLDGRKDDEIDRISIGGLRAFVEAMHRLRMAKVELAGLLYDPSQSGPDKWPATLGDGDRECLSRAYKILSQ